MALTNKKKKEIAEDLYINRGVSAKEIAEQLDVSEQTLCKWKKELVGGKDWELRRIEINNTPLKIKERLLREADSLSQGNKPTIDADSLSKITSAIDKLNKKVNPQIISDVFRAFDKYMVDIDPQTAILFTKFHKQYLLHSIAIETN